MKKKIKSFEEFESRLKQQSIPMFHYNEKINHHIAERKKNYIRSPLKTSFIVLFISLFTFASISIAVEFGGFKFFNGNSEQILEIVPVSEKTEKEDKERVGIQEKYHSITKDIEDKLPEGKIAYFLAVEAYEIDPNFLYVLGNNQKINSVTEIPSDFTDSLSLKDSLLDTFILTEGTVMYKSPEFDISNKAEELYLKAIEENLPYSYEEDDLTSEAYNVELLYDHKEEKWRSISIIISEVDEGISTHQNFFTDYTQISEEGIDFLYNQDIQQIIYIVEENNKKLMVSIDLNTQERQPLDLEQFMPIIKSIQGEKNGYE